MTLCRTSRLSLKSLPILRGKWRAFGVSLLVAASLSACSDDPAPSIAPLSPEALAAVNAHPGTRREPLARAVDAVFTREDVGETRALLVLHNGKIVAQRYAEGYDPQSRFLGWSISKSVTGVIIGMLVADGRLHLDQSAPISRWQRTGDPRGEITLRHLLQMRSGLRHQEQADPIYTSAETRMLFLDGRDDTANFAEAQPLDHEPGAVFTYSTASSQILSDIATRIIAPDAPPAKRQADMREFLQARLAIPLGMPSLTAEYDRSGTMLGGAMMWATAPDWARFGEFLRHGGSVKGAQIVPRGWVDFMKSESPRSRDYGASLWLNQDSGGDRQMLFPERGPSTLFAAIGHQGQYILVSPAQNLTVVRFGKTDNEFRPALVEALADIVALYPQTK